METTYAPELIGDVVNDISEFFFIFFFGIAFLSQLTLKSMPEQWQETAT